MMPGAQKDLAVNNPLNFAAEELKVWREITLAPELWRKRWNAHFSSFVLD